MRAVSNEKIIAALLQHGSVKDAAAAAGTTPRTIYDRMCEKEFKVAYMDAQSDLVRKAVFSINSKLSAAVDAVMDIMTDPAVNPAVRLQAAQTIMNNAARFSERLIKEEEAIKEEEFSVW